MMQIVLQDLIKFRWKIIGKCESIFARNATCESGIRIHEAAHPGSIPFADYSTDELGQILANLAADEGYTLPEDIRRKATQYLEISRQTELHFGNGRAVRNLFGEMKMLMARRLMAQPAAAESLDKETLVTFALEDVPDVDLSETLFAIQLRDKGATKITAPQDVISNDPTLAE